jgi:glycogen phosphorylase
MSPLDINNALGTVNEQIFRASDGPTFAAAIREKLRYHIGIEPENARSEDWLLATVLALRVHVVDRWLETQHKTRGRKRVYYLSIEYLIGRLLFNILNNMEAMQPVRAALNLLGVDINKLRALEPDAALGNGGLGRLAACFMDSMATLGIAAYGYGIRYENGLFRQQILDGWQNESADDWLTFDNPWEFKRRHVILPVGFGGAIEYHGGDPDTAHAIWHPAEFVSAEAYDTPVVGYKGRHVNTLRLWSARPTDAIAMAKFNEGDHVGAVAARAKAEAISLFLYPSNDNPAGEELRLRQEYFFTTASLQDIVQRHFAEHGNIASFADHVSVQMNDTHPALAVAELMRILVDECAVSWPDAWRTTTTVLNYTNHTLLPEALETWPVTLMNRLLPRHMQIIFLINWRHLQKIASAKSDATDLAAISLIDEHGERRVRMGHLAFVGSNKINGVSALHTDLMQRTAFRDLSAAYPGRIVNKTNGVDFRRWLFQANPRLTQVIVEIVGEGVLDDGKHLKRLEAHIDDGALLARIADVRAANKRDLCTIVREQTGIKVDPEALFDVHIKRFHEYKRQLLNILETIALFHSIHAEPNKNWVPRVKIFSGKAATTYDQAKLIIKLINDVAHVVNSDPLMKDRLKVIFLANYGVSLAEAIVPAADLSEQISTAGYEASGTGNMKLALNGALTIGTLDGANVEICERVGSENIFIFGLNAQSVAERRGDRFAGRNSVFACPLLEEAIKGISAGAFSRDAHDRFRPIVDRILNYDEYMVAADFESYWESQRIIDGHWSDQGKWLRFSLLNTARMSEFSSDRAVREYAQEIWNVPVEVQQSDELTR